MHFEAAIAIFRVIADNYSHYPAATQRTLLEGIYELADECQENLKRRSDLRQVEDLQTSFEMTKLFAEDAFKSGKFAEGFRSAAECCWSNAAVLESLP
jgi:hypothetical protein